MYKVLPIAQACVILVIMKQIAVTIKIDDELKADVQALAKNMGLSFSSIVENKLREVRRERRVEFTEEFIPNKKFAKELLEIEEDIKAGRNMTGPMEVDEAVKYLMSLPHAD